MRIKFATIFSLAAIGLLLCLYGENQANAVSPPPVSVTPLRLQQGGVSQGYVTKLNCTTGLTCTASNSTGTILASGTFTGAVSGTTGTFSSGVVSSSMDTAAAGALTLGGTTATSVQAGSTSATLTAPGGILIAPAKNIDVSSAGSLLLGQATATSVTVGPAATGIALYVPAGIDQSTTGPATLPIGSTNASSVTIGKAGTAARNGVRNAASRLIYRNLPTAPTDCAGATLNLTVAEFLDAGIATCATSQTINLPTWQGSTGIVQNLPGTPAVGDMVRFLFAATAANALTIGFGTGGTNGSGSASVAASATRQIWCRITAVTAGSETATCY